MARLVKNERQLNYDQLRLVGVDGNQLGVVSKAKAFELAKAAGLDLVVVSDQSNPPVCRILDYGKLCYDQKRKHKSQKKHQIVQKLKELRFHANTDGHDFQVKLTHAEEFLKKGYKVKLALVFRGREAAYQDQGFEMINKALKLLEAFGNAEGPPVLAGKSILASLNPK